MDLHKNETELKAEDLREENRETNSQAANPSSAATTPDSADASVDETSKPVFDPLKGQKYIGGKYSIQELIGSGGMGTVYKVRHEALGRTYALKVLNTGIQTDEKTILRFDQEAKAAGALHHENLISVYDYGVSDEGIVYFVMDYLEGDSLDDVIKRLGRVSEQRAITIFEAVCKGLAHAHSKGIVHRDLKPSNIILVRDADGNETPKIVDFGIAKRQVVDAKLTQTGEVFGTPLYMSPEQCMGNSIDARSDIYSLGCVMYEALSGVSPFSAENAIKTIFKHVNEDASNIKKVTTNEQVSSGLAQTIHACMERNPEFRVQSADALALNLERIRSGKAPYTATTLRNLRRLRPHAKTAMWMWILISSSIAIMTVCLYAKSRFESPSYVQLSLNAKAASDAGNYAQAAKFADQALADAKKHRLTDLENFMVASYACSAYAWDSQSEKSAHQAGIAFDYAKRLGDLKNAVLFGFRKGLYEQGADRPDAQQYLQESLEASKKISGSRIVMRNLYDAGEGWYHQKLYQQAIPFLERGREIGRTLPDVDKHQLYRNNELLIRTYCKIDDPAKARRLVDETQSVVGPSDRSKEAWDRVLKQVKDAEAKNSANHK